jgi:alanine racemase
MTDLDSVTAATISTASSSKTQPQTPQQIPPSIRSDASIATATTVATTINTVINRDVSTNTMMRPTDTIVVPNLTAPPPPDPNQRAIHRIRLSALQHNFSRVESAANRQRCSVIVVVKADGYGHGAVATALHLADRCGADSFAVATLEEAIALRRAFENNPPGRWNKNLASHFWNNPQHQMSDVNSHQHRSHQQHQQHEQQQNQFQQQQQQHQRASATNSSSRSDSPTLEAAARVMRPARIRILVLGPPVGYPRCFDDYYHHGIEVMVSGPEVAASLLEWLANDGERKRTQVERSAMEAKAHALLVPSAPRDAVQQKNVNFNNNNFYNSNNGANGSGGKAGEEKKQERDVTTTSADGSPKLGEGGQRKMLRHPSSTLGNVQGQDLANELRAILMNQNKAAAGAAHTSSSMPVSKRGSTDSLSSESSVASDKGSIKTKANSTASTATMTVVKPGQAPQVFGGIEAVAKDSRFREMAVARKNEVLTEDGEEDEGVGAVVPNGGGGINKIAPAINVVGTRKRLRWHALVDSGMGRLGFRTDPIKKDDPSGKRDTVEILKELLDLEIHGQAPLEFYGMCTHMADANSTSDYTNSQISKFVGLLRRVRAAGISVPTVSTDNSAALLTTNLTHFDPAELLTQPHAHTRGYVRTGGAIYGQRPAFKQLKAVSTLLASVRHVAILKEGESVGYDRAYIAPRDVRIATLTLGFADGYPRELGNGVGKVAIRGALFPVAGNVCMDMLMVELGPAEEKEGVGATVVVGDVAVLWGPLDEDGDDDEGLVKLADLAKTLKTTQSALTCGLDKIRVLRQFV